MSKQRKSTTGKIVTLVTALSLLPYANTMAAPSPLGFKTRHASLTELQKTDFKRNYFEKYGFLYGDFNKDGKIAPLLLPLSVWQGKGDVEGNTYLSQPGELVKGAFEESEAKPTYFQAKAGKLFVFEDGKITDREFIPNVKNERVYQVQGAADWVDFTGEGKYLLDKNEAGLVGIANLLTENWNEYHGRIERTPVINGREEWGVVFAQTNAPTTETTDPKRGTQTDDKKYVIISKDKVNEAVARYSSAGSRSRKPKGNHNLKLLVEALALTGGGTHEVSGNERDSYGNKILAHKNEGIGQAEIELGAEASIGKFSMKGGYAAYSIAGKGSSDNFERKDLNVAYTIGKEDFKVTPALVADSTHRRTNKHNLGLDATVGTRGPRVGWELGLQYGKLGAELGYLTGTHKRVIDGKLMGVPFKRPEGTVDSSRFYMELSTDLEGFGTSLFYENEDTTGVAKSTRSRLGIEVSKQDLWKTKAGNFGLTGRLVHTGIKNHGYAKNTSGFGAMIGANWNFNYNSRKAGKNK